MTDTTTTVDTLVNTIVNHRVYNHPIWENWAANPPGPTELGALFHQIQKFCASTRPGLAFPDGLAALGLTRQRELIEEIVESESGHGAELARMAGKLINQTAETHLIEEVDDQAAVEGWLRSASDSVFGHLDGYTEREGLTAECAAAIEVFDRRANGSPNATLRNLGTALALEVISNRSLIPGEKQALVDSGNYRVALEDPDMHYLEEHWGECGAEQQHERNVIEAVGEALTPATEAVLVGGVNDFLDSLAALWDVLDRTVLSGSDTPTPAMT